MVEPIRIFDQSQLSSDSSMAVIEILNPSQIARFNDRKAEYQIADARIRTMDKNSSESAAYIQLESSECEDDEGDSAYIARFEFTMFEFREHLNDYAVYEGVLYTARYTTDGEPELDSKNDDEYKYIPNKVGEDELRYCRITVYPSKSPYFNIAKFIEGVETE